MTSIIFVLKSQYSNTKWYRKFFFKIPELGLLFNEMKDFDPDTKEYIEQFKNFFIEISRYQDDYRVKYIPCLRKFFTSNAYEQWNILRLNNYFYTNDAWFLFDKINKNLNTACFSKILLLLLELNTRQVQRVVSSLVQKPEDYQSQVLTALNLMKYYGLFYLSYTDVLISLILCENVLKNNLSESILNCIHILCKSHISVDSDLLKNIKSRIHKSPSLFINFYQIIKIICSHNELDSSMIYSCFYKILKTPLTYNVFFKKTMDNSLLKKDTFYIDPDALEKVSYTFLTASGEVIQRAIELDEVDQNIFELCTHQYHQIPCAVISSSIRNIPIQNMLKDAILSGYFSPLFEDLAPAIIKFFKQLNLDPHDIDVYLKLIYSSYDADKFVIDLIAVSALGFLNFEVAYLLHSRDKKGDAESIRNIIEASRLSIDIEHFIKILNKKEYALEYVSILSFCHKHNLPIDLDFLSNNHYYSYLIKWLNILQNSKILNNKNLLIILNNQDIFCNVDFSSIASNIVLNQKEFITLVLFLNDGVLLVDNFKLIAIKITNYLISLSEANAGLKTLLLMDFNSINSALLPSITKTCSYSALRLSILYEVKLNNPSVWNSELRTWEEELRSKSLSSQTKKLYMKGIFGFGILMRYKNNFVDPYSGVSLFKLMYICFLAIHDKDHLYCSTKVAEARLISGMSDIVGGLGSKSKTHVILCPQGMFNKLIESLTGVHQLVSMRYMSIKTAGEKLKCLVINNYKGYILGHLDCPPIFEQVWPIIKQNVGDQLFEEFAELFPGGRFSEKFLELLEVGQDVSVNESCSSKYQIFGEYGISNSSMLYDSSEYIDKLSII